MDVLQKLRNKVAAARDGDALPQEISEPMLNRIGGEVAGGALNQDLVVWCKAAWGKNCDKVNIT